MIEHVARAAFVALSVVICCSCSGTPAERESIADPELGFLILPLVEGATNPLASVWSQNDDVDSVSVVILHSDTMTLNSSNLVLVGRHHVEGDGFIDPAGDTAVSVPYESFGARKAMGLPAAREARVVASVRPSKLWDHFKAVAGQDMEVDSLYVSVVLSNGRTLRKGLALLFD